MRLANCYNNALQAHCVREQAANYGDFRQAMLRGAQEAIRAAGAQLAVPTSLHYQDNRPWRHGPLPSTARDDGRLQRELRHLRHGKQCALRAIF